MRGYPWRTHRCMFCRKQAVTYPYGHPLCAFHASEPDSEVYRVQADELEKRYMTNHSKEEWGKFCQRAFWQDGKAPDDFTWKEIAQAIENEIEHPETCNCVLPEQSCKACTTNTEDIPY